MHAFLVSFGVIFVAELGDKSQLVALTLATRHRVLPVLVGITIATALVHAASVIGGAALAGSLPTTATRAAAGVAFLGFAAWTLRGDSLDEDDDTEAPPDSAGTAIVAVSVAFFIAELGDKTMLATITLATQEGAWGTWAGSTLGMVGADALAIAIGSGLASRLSHRTVRIGAAVGFVIFGVLLLADAAMA